MQNVTNLKIWLEHNAHKLNPKQLDHAKKVWDYANAHPNKLVLFNFESETEYLNQNPNKGK
jgi:hypothetical protein